MRSSPRVCTSVLFINPCVREIWQTSEILCIISTGLPGPGFYSEDEHAQCCSKHCLPETASAVIQCVPSGLLPGPSISSGLCACVFCLSMLHNTRNICAIVALLHGGTYTNIADVYYYFFADGHHKLVRWGLVTHGGIDGYSRLVFYLQCSGNNRASTQFTTSFFH